MKVIIDGKSVNASAGDTIVQVAERNNIYIPTLCYMKNIKPSSSCRICLVEVKGQKNLVTACSYLVYDGMEIITNSKRVVDARKTNLELILSNHNYDCENCARDKTCTLQKLAQIYNADANRFNGDKTKVKLDTTSPAIIRDNSKCILCKKCVNACKVQSVNAITSTNRGFNTEIFAGAMSGLNKSSCIACGACVRVCPTGALTENFSISGVLREIQDNNKYVIAIPAPSIKVALSEGLGFNAGKSLDEYLPAVLKEIGFNKVFDVTMTADLTVVEETAELLERLENSQDLPLLTSCCPAWVDYVAKFYPKFRKNISSVKSPQQMMGAVIKGYFAQKHNIDPSKIVVVSIMPCTAKKAEVKKYKSKLQDVDYSLTARELIHIIKHKNINIKNLKKQPYDSLMGEGSGAGVIFGASGGVMEAALRTTNEILNNGKKLEINYREVEEFSGIFMADVKLGAKVLKVAVTSGLNNAKKLLNAIDNKKLSLDFVEVMACDGGCINGGGMPYSENKDVVAKRTSGLRTIDKNKNVRLSHKNKDVIEFISWQKNNPGKVHLHTR